ncbi:MAG: hypothetical protein L0241_22720 [Planctomycetia bacterium]|nr:hypothetical protein [Planctomycetia bacterium]
MLQFGQIPAQSKEHFDLAVSDDKRALTFTFSELQAKVGGGKSPVATSTRVFSQTLPLEGDEERVEIEFIVQGYVVATEGATAAMVCSVNGQTTVTDFPGQADQSIVQKLKFTAKKPSECRLCTFLMVGRDSRNADAEVQLNVTSIDVEILPRPK